MQKGQSLPATFPPFLLPSLPSLEGLLRGPGPVGVAGPGDLCSRQEQCQLCLLGVITAAAPALPAATLAPTGVMPDRFPLDLPLPVLAGGWRAKLLHQVWTNPKGSLRV